MAAVPVAPVLTELPAWEAPVASDLTHHCQVPLLNMVGAAAVANGLLQVRPAQATMVAGTAEKTPPAPLV